MSEMSKIDPPCDAQRHGEVAPASAGAGIAQRVTEEQGGDGPSTHPAATSSACGEASLAPLAGSGEGGSGRRGGAFPRKPPPS